MKRLAVALALGLTPPLHAAAGLWLPRQLPAIENSLRQAGIAVDPKQLADPARYPWNAVIRLGDDCSASLVSPLGLILTSRDCVPAAGTGDGRDLQTGVVASTLGEELPGGPDLRAEIIDRISDVTAEIRAGAQGGQDAAAIGKQLLAACQIDPAYRCTLDAVDEGVQYWLIRRLQIRDLRLVYLPASAAEGAAPAAGNIALYRAYVGPDGQAAGYSESNVPLRPGAYLRLQAAGGKSGDFVFSAGYPAITVDASLRVAYGHIQAEAVAPDHPAAVPIDAAGAPVDGAARATVASAAPTPVTGVADAGAATALEVDVDAIGRAGGPLLNARAELVGVAIAAVASAATTAAAPARATVGAVDVRQLQRQLEAAPGAQGLLQEMGIQAVVADGK